MLPQRGAWGKGKLIIWGRSSWIVHQINIKLMSLQKKIFLHQIIDLTKNLALRPVEKTSIPLILSNDIGLLDN